MAAGNWLMILKLSLWHNIYIWSGRIFDICSSFMSGDFELGRNVRCEESTVSTVRS